MLLNLFENIIFYWLFLSFFLKSARDRAILTPMKRQRRSLLSPLLDQVPPGFLVDARWLAANGMGASVVRNYLDRGWLERLARGVYRRPLPDGTAMQSVVPWKIALLSLQRIMNFDVHMGGLSTLDLLEDACRQQSVIHIYGEAPAWLSRVPTDRPFTVHGRRHFKNDETGILETAQYPDWSILMAIWLWQMKASSCERALLEVLVDLCSDADFDYVDAIFGSVSLVRPHLMTEVLAACQSMTVRRLFFVFADRHPHGYLKRMDRSAIDLGSGPRVLFEGGKAHPEYNIYVPERFLPGAGEAGQHA